MILATSDFWIVNTMTHILDDLDPNLEPTRIQDLDPTHILNLDPKLTRIPNLASEPIIRALSPCNRGPTSTGNNPKITTKAELGIHIRED